MRNNGKWLSRVALYTLLAGGVSACSGGGQGLDPLSVQLFNFAPGFAGVALNAPLELTFTAPVAPGTVTQDSIRIFTTTTTTAEPDPGAPAIGTFEVIGETVRFLPRIPQNADLSDAGLRIGFTYTIQVPSSPTVIEPVRTIEGRPNVVDFAEFFTTLNSTILPAPGDITAEPNLNSLSRFFVDEWRTDAESFGFDPCPRQDLPLADRDSPQVIDTDPDEGESGFGTITGIQAGLGTAFVRLDPITLLFSEPVGPWRIRPQNISIRNTNLGGETFDLFFFFTQDRTESRLQITVFDADSAFDQASVPQGRYVLSLTDFSDLAGNPLVNSNTCTADGTFQLSFSTVTSPAQPTDIKLTMQDDDNDGHVDVGGLATPVRNVNAFVNHEAPFLGGLALQQVAMPSPSNQITSANWGNIALWTGCNVLYDNGFDPTNTDDDDMDGNPDFDRPIPAVLRLRGGANRAATPIMSPIAGNAGGPTNTLGTQTGIVNSAEPGKVDFILTGAASAALFTGDLNTGPILYHYNSFTMAATSETLRPTVTARSDSIFPLIIFVEDDAFIAGSILADGRAGEFGFNGLNDDSDASAPRNVGGLGGNGGPGGGDGGNGGAATYGVDVTLLDGETGGVPANLLGPLDQLSESVAGLVGMATGGGGHWDEGQITDDPAISDANNNTVFPGHQGGGGAGTREDGGSGADINGNTPGETDQGVGGRSFGNDTNFRDAMFLTYGGAGGGGGAAEDDGAVDQDNTLSGPDDESSAADDGGGGGGGGGGFIGFSCNGDITLGEVITDMMGMITERRFAVLRAVGGRGGSTYAQVARDPGGTITSPVEPGTVPGSPDISSALGAGNAGGGGGGGGICVTAGGQITFVALEAYAFGKVGGNSPNIEGGGRTVNTQAGNGGAGILIFADSDGVDVPAEIGANNLIQLTPDPNRDLDQDGTPDLAVGSPERRDLAEMTGGASITFTVWGDDTDEVTFGTSQIITEFFDTLSDSVSYDEVRVLSNAPRFPYSVATPSSRTIRVFVDTTGSAGGFPDLTTEDATGALLQPNGFTLEAGLHFNGTPPQMAGDPPIGADLGTPQFESRMLIPAGSPSLGNRFARVRIVFDLSLIGTPSDLLGNDPGDQSNVFDPIGPDDLVIADDPGTPGLENTLGNIDRAQLGVPAVAEVRVRFTP